MNLDRDKFLTEAMGLCWHECTDPSVFRFCKNCNQYIPANYIQNDFSTWEGFGKLWNWVMNHDRNWILDFEYECETLTNWKDLINPDRFADAVYEFLKERK